ncbi:MAG: MraY family glycosyltransferase [Candidatus Falkowbacteria bacterium]
MFVLSAVISAFFTYFTIKLAKKLQVVDLPDNNRKLHAKPIPLLGGLAIFAAFFLLVFWFKDILLSSNLQPSHYFGFFIGGMFLVAGGFLDDKYDLSPVHQLIFPALAIAAVIAGGVSIEKITNPFGGFIYLKFWSTILIAAWLLGMMYATKLLDGLDGLVTGVTGIGGVIIFLFTISARYYQPDIALASLLFAGACLGFLVFNWHPAKIFLGEGGSLLLGYILGVLAIISGGKFAIALLIMGIPILDMIWTVIRRLVAGKNPFKFSDRQHLHHRLHDSGLGHRKTVLIYYAFALIFGLSALFLQSSGKMLAILGLIVAMVAILVVFNWLDRQKQRTKHHS